MTVVAETRVDPERQRKVVHALAPVLPAHALLHAHEDVLPYECDGLSAYRQAPMVVALPETEAEVARILTEANFRPVFAGG